jgi:ketosteroid isomerase-like protein
MKANGKTEAAVLAVMDKWLQSYQERDLDGLMSLVSPDGDLLIFGTDIDEKRIGRDEFKAQVERDWAQTEALAFNLSEHRISAAGPVAWVAAEGVGKGKAGGQQFEFPFRMTSVFEQQGDKWYMVQSHASLPAPAQEEGDSVPV